MLEPCWNPCLLPTWTDLNSAAELPEETSQQWLQPVVQLSTPRSAPTDGNLQTPLEKKTPYYGAYFQLRQCHPDTSGSIARFARFCQSNRLMQHVLRKFKMFKRPGSSERVHYLTHIIRCLHRSNNQVLSVTLPLTLGDSRYLLRLLHQQGLPSWKCPRSSLRTPRDTAPWSLLGKYFVGILGHSKSREWWFDVADGFTVLPIQVWNFGFNRKKLSSMTVRKRLIHRLVLQDKPWGFGGAIRKLFAMICYVISSISRQHTLRLVATKWWYKCRGPWPWCPQDLRTLWNLQALLGQIER